MPRVLVPLAEGCEELEAVTVIDLLRRAEVEVVSASLEAGPIRASRGVVLVADESLEDVLDQDFDMIVLPGGVGGAQRLQEDPRVIGLLQRLAGEGRYTAAICAGPKVLATAGLLDGRRATSYPGALDSARAPGMDYCEQPVVRDERVVTSRGPGTAMDFALELITLLCGRERRDQVEQALQRP